MLVKVLNCDTLNCSIKQCLDEYIKDRGIENIYGCTGQNVWEDYLEYCQEHNYPVEITAQSFRKKITMFYDITSIVRKIDGKSVRILVKKQ